MANALYPKWKTAMLSAAANAAPTGSGATGLFAALVNTSVYTYNAAHQFFSSLTGLPVTPNGGDITVTWNASGIFTL